MGIPFIILYLGLPINFEGAILEKKENSDELRELYFGTIIWLIRLQKILIIPFGAAT